MRVLVAMSGGVDSSVAAALLKEEGHEVTGVTLKLWQGPNGEAPTAGCCTVSDAEDARRVAAQLDIPYYVFDYTSHFHTGVVDHFIGDYLNGRTPNPCVECNRTVKFSRLLDQAQELRCDLLVTGHYARVTKTGDRYQLRRGRDRRKDQSYVLSMLTQRELCRVRFPVGELRKEETREIAGRIGLRTARKPDSQDICFVGRGGYRSFLARLEPGAVAPGPIVDSDGHQVGEHTGIAGFTIGQRRGVGVAVGERRYVVAVEPDSATVVIGRQSELEVQTVDLERVTWVDHPPLDGEPIEVQYRAHGEAAPGRWKGGSVEFEHPQLAVAPGQTAAFYRGDQVLGGGVISATR
ncbi:MAG TPA: tRNA 2-thiouridine(34) synthase MnmA [Acidimicrobiia bacterium]|nr:tRNA 2-thiouridine(34) synthase MnmA [Acidimicrobiia bacterium]